MELSHHIHEGLFHNPICLAVRKGFFVVMCYPALKNDYIKENLVIPHAYSLGIRIASIYFSASDTLAQLQFPLPLQNKYSSEARNWPLFPVLRGQ